MTDITSTYRVQFGGEMDFAKAASLAPYLSRLGVSHLYASPVFEAASGSTHGYDVCDYNSLSAALGGRDGFERMAEALKEEGVGLILDIVPNHMSASSDNVWLADVMAKGRASSHADAFDIDWEKGEGRLTLPVLGAPLEEVLGAGEIRIEDDERFGRAVRYYDKRFPLAEGTGEGPLEEVLAAQHYRLHFWRDLGALNYRRFFDITDLIGVRMEDGHVFDAAHRLLSELIGKGTIDGVRVDHVDGMRDPEGYLARLAGLFPARGGTPPVFVEKILEGEERLPEDWPVRGETGYAVMSWLDGVFTSEVAEAPLTALYEELTGDGRAFGEVVATAKREIIAGPFAHEFDTLAKEIAAETGEDKEAVRHVIEDIAAAFPVYRTYQREGEGGEESERLRAYAAAVPGEAKEPVLRVLTDPRRSSCLSFQQMTGPVMAKAVEDTSFYRWHRWSALNEVGGEPEIFGRSADAFHDRMNERAQKEPLAMTATATHDTKRGEDVRARLAAATHRPEDWAGFARRFFAASAGLREGVADETAYLLFQLAVGIWPLEGEETEEGLPERLEAYAVKAERERKRDTAWTRQDQDYEARAARLARACAEGDLGRIAKEAAVSLWPQAADISVARAVLKATVPGIPDIYQGTEVTQLVLVDPDNRRAPDWDRLSAMTQDGSAGGRKAAATAALLRSRRENPALFLSGDYRPQKAPVGAVRFCRTQGSQKLDVVVAITPGTALPTPEGELVFADQAAMLGLAQTD